MGIDGCLHRELVNLYPMLVQTFQEQIVLDDILFVDDLYCFVRILKTYDGEFDFAAKFNSAKTNSICRKIISAAV